MSVTVGLGLILLGIGMLSLFGTLWVRGMGK